MPIPSNAGILDKCIKDAGLNPTAHIKRRAKDKAVITPDYLSYAEQARVREKSGFGM